MLPSSTFAKHRRVIIQMNHSTAEALPFRCWNATLAPTLPTAEGKTSPGEILRLTQKVKNYLLPKGFLPSLNAHARSTPSDFWVIHQLSLFESPIPLSGWGYELACLLIWWFAMTKNYLVESRGFTNTCEERAWQKDWEKKKNPSGTVTRVLKGKIRADWTCRVSISHDSCVSALVICHQL